MGNGEWGMGNGEWGVGNEEWGMGNGEWGVGSGEWGNNVKSQNPMSNSVNNHQKNPEAANTQTQGSAPTPHSPLPTPLIRFMRPYCHTRLSKSSTGLLTTS